jgi:hypothetical protein
VTPLILHLEAQTASAERLLATVVAQTEAIKTQDVPTLIARLGDVQTELGIRRQLELDRERLMHEAAVRNGVPLHAIDFEALISGAPADVAGQARTLSTHLRTVLARVARIHANNRALIRQELTFVDHLIRLVSGIPQAGYSADGWSTPTRPVTSVDARA